MTSEAAIVQLVETGFLLDAARAIDALPNATNFLRVTRANLEIDVGSLSVARSMSEMLLRERLTHSEKSDCWKTIAFSDLSSGEIECGLRSMHNAFSAAEMAQDPRKQARLIVSNCEALINWVGIEPAV